LAAIVATLAFLAAPAFGQTKAKAPAVSPDAYWAGRVEPLLDKYCLKCHAGVRQRGGLDLRSLETALRGGDSGPAILPGSVLESHVVQYVQPKAPLHMPPDAGRQLTADEIAVLRRWVAMLPAPKSKPPDAAPARLSWAQAYLADYKRTFQRRETPPASLSPSATIDWFLKTDQQREGITAAGPCGDAVFARRLYLDVAGRIPTDDEAHRYLGDPPAERRQRLAARLLDSPDYARHMREVFDAVLMGRPTRKNVKQRADSGWYAFLENGFKENRPWNEMVRDMLLARSTDGPGRGADWFIAERNNNHQAIAEAVAPVVFGVQIGCAQCHNHPLVWEIEQRHYWGLVAAFDRSKNVETDKGTGVAESAVGGFIKFANLKKETQPADLVFLNGKSIPERVPGPDEKQVDSPALYLVPPAPDGRKPHSPAVPKQSRREAFADLATRDNVMLARTFVNRMWADLMGRGIVQPADQIDSRHPPSHPELLEWLTLDFDHSRYDVKRLVRNIVLSRAYERDARPPGKKAPPPEAFAVALDKPMTAEQLLQSLWVATGTKPDDAAAAQSQRAFASTFPDVMPENYSPTLQQALFLSNSSALDDLLKPAPGNTAAKLLALPSSEARVREAFARVLGRQPDALEMKQCRPILDAQPGERGVRSLLWALLTCAEFQVNH
jgi:hypothetical protein